MQLIRPTMIMAFEPDNLGFAGIGPGQPHSPLDGRGAGVVKANLLDGGHRLADAARGFDFQIVGQGKQATARLEGMANGVSDRLGAMPQNQRAAGHQVIDVFIAIHVDGAGPPTAAR